MEEENDAPWVAIDKPGGVPDGEEKPTPCTDSWKASATDVHKKSLAVYETMGIFPSAC